MKKNVTMRCFYVSICVFGLLQCSPEVKEILPGIRPGQEWLIPVALHQPYERPKLPPINNIDPGPRSPA